MRRLIQAAAIALLLIPRTSWAHDEGVAGGGGGGDNGGGGQAGGGEQGGTGAGSGDATVDRNAVVGPTALNPQDQLPFRGSTILFDQSVTPETIFPGSQLSPVPSYQWWISFRPRWYLTHDISVRVRADITYEWFQGAANTTHLYEAQWGDIWTDLVYSGLPSVAGVKFAVGLRALWPVSLASQMHGTYVTLGATVGATRVFHLPAHSDITAGISFAGSHAFTQTTAGGLAGGSTYGCSSLDEGVPSTCDSNGGPMNAAFTLLSIFSATYNTPVHGLAVDLFYLVASSWAYPPTSATITDPMGGTTVVPTSNTATTQRQLEWFLVSLDYEMARYLTMSVGYYCYRPVLDMDSTYGDPFYSPGGNSRIFMTATIAFDGLYQTLFRTSSTGTGHASNDQNHTYSMNSIAHEITQQRLMNGSF